MRAKSVFFHILILSTIIGTAWLGVWQLQRREWKHDILERLENSYRIIPPPLRQGEGKHSDELAYTHQIITGDCAAQHISLQPGRYYQGRAGYHVFCSVKNSAGENLLVQLGWVEKFNPANSNAIIHLKNPALLLPFAPRPWWLPQANNPHETMWPSQPPAPAYAVYAVLDAQHGAALPGTDIIPVGERPELPDDHLQYAITWFTLAGMLLALYIYRTWLQSSVKIQNPDRFKGNS